jgi:chromosome partitioning protein
MPVIPTVNTKGGSGKSTTANILATTLARMGATVRLIDCDPQGTNARWGREGQSKYRDIVVPLVVGEDLTDLIDRLATEVQFVVIDVQGSANMEISAAVSRADLVLIPAHGKTADAEVIPTTLELLGKQEKMFRRPIERRVVFIGTNPQIARREEKKLRNEAVEAGVPLTQTDLNDRAAFSDIFQFKLALDELNDKDTNGLPKANVNAVTFTNEVVEIVRSLQKGKEVA